MNKSKLLGIYAGLVGLCLVVWMPGICLPLAGFGLIICGCGMIYHS